MNIENDSESVSSEDSYMSFDTMTKNYECTGEWRSCAAVPGGEYYECNDRGEVRHIVRKRLIGSLVRGYKCVSLGRDADGKRRHYLISRLVWRIFCDLEIPDFLEIDHRDRNPVNNCLSNLHPVTKSDNCYNRENRGVSTYKGLYWNKQTGKWLARIWLDGKMRYIGYFVDEEEAARVFDYLRRTFQPNIVADYSVTINGLDVTGVENHPKVIKFIAKYGDLLD